MGNKQQKGTPAASAASVPETDAQDQEIEEIQEEEANPFIRLVIFYELPSGSTTDHVMTVNPHIQVGDFRKELSALLQIPVPHLRIYLHINRHELLPDSATLHALHIRQTTQLRVRDSRHTYTQPL